MDDEAAEFGLVMPFVVCQSVGGPYEDDAFCAGYAAGTLAMLLVSKPGRFTETVRTDVLPQLDLIAMDAGYSMVPLGTDESDEWTHVEFSRAVEVPL